MKKIPPIFFVVTTGIVILLGLHILFCPDHGIVKKAVAKARLEKLKQEAIAIGLPLALTEKERKLVALKAEVLKLIEDAKVAE